MTRVLVTGGRGFIGSHLVNYLKTLGYWVRSVDIEESCPLPTTEDEFMRLDLRSFTDCMKAIHGIEQVYNLAANMGGVGWIMEYNASIMHDNSLINVNMLDASTHEGVDKFFFSSSACTYNRNLQMEPESPPLKESDAIPAYPDSAYGWEKLYTELLCKNYEYDYGLPVRIARFHNIYGTHTVYDGGREKYPAALCRKVAKAKDGESIVLWGDGKQRRSYLYVDDCCEAFYELTQSDFNEPLNVGTNRSIGVDELAKIVIDISGKELTIEHDLTKPQGVRGRNCDLTLTKKTLKWLPTISLEVGMKRLYHWVDSQLMS